MKEKILVAWSGGKDSAFALYELQKMATYEISALLTVITADYNRISMHGVRQILVEQQAELLGLPLKKVYITKNSSNEEYEVQMRKCLMCCKEQGITSVAFGDIFLEDVRKYREENLARIDMKAIFPLWQRNTSKVASNFLNLGFKAVVTCVDSSVLGKQFAGRIFDEQFLSCLPESVDPCGENGEFHSFVYAGPIFKSPISYSQGDIVLRDNRFYYCDLVPVPI